MSTAFAERDNESHFLLEKRIFSQFLLSLVSGPPLSARLAHREISLSCHTRLAGTFIVVVCAEVFVMTQSSKSTPGIHLRAPGRNFHH